MKFLKSGVLFALAIGMMLSMAACGPAADKQLTMEEYADTMVELESGMDGLFEMELDVESSDSIELFVKSFGAIIDKFSVVVPPEKLTDAHSKMSEGLSEMKDGIAMLGEMAKNTDADALVDGYADFMAKMNSATVLVEEASDLYADADVSISDSLVGSLFG